MFPVIKADVGPPVLKIRCHKITAGTTFEGWVIGPVVVAVTHWNGEASKPCRNVMSGGALECYCKTSREKQRKIGYVPLISSDGERVVIIVSNGVAGQFEFVTKGAPVVLGRTLIPKSPVWWKGREVPEGQKAKNTQVQRMERIDIRPWLLNLWDDGPLRRYYLGAETSSEQPGIISAPIPAQVPTVEPTPIASPAPAAKLVKTKARKPKR
jgi:hypothetical protein